MNSGHSSSTHGRDEVADEIGPIAGQGAHRYDEAARGQSVIQSHSCGVVPSLGFLDNSVRCGQCHCVEDEGDWVCARRDASPDAGRATIAVSDLFTGEHGSIGAGQLPLTGGAVSLRRGT